LILFVAAIAVIVFFTISRNRKDRSEATVELEAPSVNFSKYQLKDVTIEGKIGGGAFGVVFRGTWMGTTVALKKLASQSELAEFEHEAEILQ
jgi:predicted Ser/Thr protein kinase